MKTTRKIEKFPTVILKSLDKKVLKVGWVTNKLYPNSTMTTAEVAAIAETGSIKRNIPPRPIMAPVNTEKASYWRRISTIEAKKILEGKQTVEGQLEILGNIISGEYRNRITEIIDPPLKEATVLARLRERNKGLKTKIPRSAINDTFRKPLVFTKYLLNSCTYAVENK